MMTNRAILMGVFATALALTACQQNQSGGGGASDCATGMNLQSWSDEVSKSGAGHFRMTLYRHRSKMPSYFKSRVSGPMFREEASPYLIGNQTISPTGIIQLCNSVVVGGDTLNIVSSTANSIDLEKKETGQVIHESFVRASAGVMEWHVLVTTNADPAASNMTIENAWRIRWGANLPGSEFIEADLLKDIQRSFTMSDEQKKHIENLFSYSVMGSEVIVPVQELNEIDQIVSGADRRGEATVSMPAEGHATVILMGDDWDSMRLSSSNPRQTVGCIERGGVLSVALTDDGDGAGMSKGVVFDVLGSGGKAYSQRTVTGIIYSTPNHGGQVWRSPQDDSCSLMTFPADSGPDALKGTLHCHVELAGGSGRRSDISIQFECARLSH